MHQSGDDPKASALVVMILRQVRISMVMIPMLHGDKTNAASKLNSTSQTEVSTEREYSPSGILSPKYRRLDND
jgi:lactam utilization protein B